MADARSRPADLHGTHEHRDETRERIVETALELIADHGFASTSTREISERLGFTKAALYYHFRTKDDLLAAIVEPVIQGLAALVGGVSPEAGPAERLAVLEGYVDLAATHADLMKVLANDPAVRRCEALQATSPLHAQLVRILLGTADPGSRERSRARAALGAVLVPFMRAEPDDDPAEVRAAVLEAACAVLGLERDVDAPRSDAAVAEGGVPDKGDPR